jgi:hypothetical protein
LSESQHCRSVLVAVEHDYGYFRVAPGSIAEQLVNRRFENLCAFPEFALCDDTDER